jgi:voltage-gated potassium channel
LRVDEVTVPAEFPPTRIGNLRLRSPDYILVAVRAEGQWVFNPTDEYLLCAGNVVIAMTSPAGRAQIDAHLREMLA